MTEGDPRHDQAPDEADPPVEPLLPPVEPQGLLGDRAMRAAVISVAVSGAMLTMVAAIFAGAGAALGVFLGGVLATANLVVFARIGQAFLSEKGRGPWAAVAIAKLVFLFGGVYLLIHHDVVSGITLAIGYGAMPLGITLGSLFDRKSDDEKKKR